MRLADTATRLRRGPRRPGNTQPRNEVVIKVNGVDMSQIGPAVGAAFPDFQLPDAAGNTISLHAWRAGRRALVVFYRSAHW